MKRLFSTSVFIALLSAFSFAQSATASNFFANNLSDIVSPQLPSSCGENGNCSLREAIILANQDRTATANNPHQIILKGNGTYILTILQSTLNETNTEEGDLDIKNHLNIDVQNGASATVEGGANFDSRIFKIASGFTVTISHLTIQKGVAPVTVLAAPPIPQQFGHGGGILNNGTLTLNQVAIKDNHRATDGGGIYNSGVLNIDRSNIELNAAGRNGGGIFCEGSAKLTLLNSTVSNNSAGNLNGGVTTVGTSTIFNSRIESNKTESENTAGLLVVSGTTTLENSTVINNISEGTNPTPHNAIFNVNIFALGNLIARNSTIEASEANHLRCIDIRNNGRLTLEKSILKGGPSCRTAATRGIEYANNGGSPTPQNLTIQNSTLSDLGIGIYVDPSDPQNATLNLDHLTIVPSDANNSSAIYIRSNQTFSNFNIKNSIIHGDCSGNLALMTSLGYNLEKNNSCLFTSFRDQQSTDPQLGPLSNYGGPTETYLLPPGSPAISHGDCTGLNGITDQRGVTRSIVCDVGAYEAILPSVAFSIQPNVIAFPAVTIGTSQSINVELRNISSIPVTFPNNGIVSTPPNSPYQVTLSNCLGATLQPMNQNSSCAIRITFTPIDELPATLTVTIPQEFLRIANAPMTFVVSGIGVLPPPNTSKISLDQTSLTFPSPIEVGNSAPLTLTVTNSGTAPLEFQGISLESNSENHFKVEGCENPILAPNGSCQLRVTFQPQSEGALTAKLVILSNAPSPDNRKEVDLSGVGTTALTSQISLSQTDFIFPETQIGGSSSQILTITNSGNISLLVPTLHLEGGQKSSFKVEGCENSLLAPNSSCAVTLTFQPQAVGSFTAKLILSSTVIAEGKEVTLTGKGVNKKIPSPAQSNQSDNNGSGGCSLSATPNSNFQTFFPLIFSMIGMFFFRRKKIKF